MIRIIKEGSSMRISRNILLKNSRRAVSRIINRKKSNGVAVILIINKIKKIIRKMIHIFSIQLKTDELMFIYVSLNIMCIIKYYV